MPKKQSSVRWPSAYSFGFHLSRSREGPLSRLRWSYVAIDLLFARPPLKRCRCRQSRADLNRRTGRSRQGRYLSPQMHEDGLRIWPGQRSAVIRWTAWWRGAPLTQDEVDRLLGSTPRRVPLTQEERSNAIDILGTMRRIALDEVEEGGRECPEVAENL